MKVNQISSELSSDIEKMSRLAHDQSISASERNQQLKELKTSVLAKIDAESNSISFAGKSFLNEIKGIVAREDWAALPEPKSIKNSLAEMKTLVAILNSLENQLLPTMEEIQRLFFEAALKQINSLTNSEISSLDKQWKAADVQFEKSKNAATAERTSAIITASVGIGVAVMSLAVKTAVTVNSRNQFDKANLKEKQDALSDARSKQTEAEANFQKISKEAKNVDSGIDAADKKLKQLKADKKNNPDISADRKTDLDTQIKEVSSELKELKKKRDELSPIYKQQKSEYEVASKIVDRSGASLDAENAAVNRKVQEFRAFLDITDSGGAILQNIFKIVNATTFDKEAADKKIESEMAAYMVNFFASSVQNTQKASSQIMDGMNSVQSSCNASIQSADSSISQAIRAV